MPARYRASVLTPWLVGTPNIRALLAGQVEPRPPTGQLGKGRRMSDDDATVRIEAAARAINGDRTGDLFGHLVERIAWSEETVDELVRHLLAAGITRLLQAG